MKTPYVGESQLLEGVDLILLATSSETRFEVDKLFYSSNTFSFHSARAFTSSAISYLSHWAQSRYIRGRYANYSQRSTWAPVSPPLAVDNRLCHLLARDTWKQILGDVSTFAAAKTSKSLHCHDKWLHCGQRLSACGQFLLSNRAWCQYSWTRSETFVLSIRPYASLWQFDSGQIFTRRVYTCMYSQRKALLQIWAEKIMELVLQR